MINYQIWKCGHTEEILVEVFNESDIPSVQKELIDTGHIILMLSDCCMNHYFIRALKLKKDPTK